MTLPETLMADAVHPASQTLRLYQNVAKHLLDQLKQGQFAIGERVPSERDLAKSLGVSRPVVREALLALEVLGFLDVRIGSGAYVVRLPVDGEKLYPEIGPIELMEARKLIEGEAAALAATTMTDAELESLEKLLPEIAEWIKDPVGDDEPDRMFHLVIARCTRNTAMHKVIDDLWELRANAPSCAVLRKVARDADADVLRAEHRVICEALIRRDGDAARAAMHAHMDNSIERVRAVMSGVSS